MSITNPDIKSYIKDTQQNILTRDSTEQGIWAFASDTGNIFVSNAGGWLQYNSDTSTGNTTLIHNNVTTQLPFAALGHFDASDVNTLTSPSKSPVSDLESVGRWKSTDNGMFALEAQRISQTPMYLAEGMGTNLPGVDFAGTKLISPMIQNKHTYTGDFTTFMVLKFKPVWLNGDYSPTGVTDANHPGWEGTNERVGNPPVHIGIYGSCTNTDDRSSIGAGIEEHRAATHHSYFRYRLPRGGHHTPNTYAYTNVFTSTYNSKTATGYNEFDENRRKSQVHANLRNIGLNWGDRMILSWRSQSPIKNTLSGSVDFQIAGDALNIHPTWSLGDHVLRGLSIGQGTAGEDGGWMTVGEMFVFNNYVNNSNMNKIGDYLSTKWSTPWVDMI